MKTYSGSIDVPHRTCQTLGQIAEGPGQIGISQEQLAERVAVEWLHDHDSHRATYDMSETERYQRLCAEHAGRCPCCGQPRVNREQCPICKSPLWQEKIADAVGMVTG